MFNFPSHVKALKQLIANNKVVFGLLLLVIAYLIILYLYNPRPDVLSASNVLRLLSISALFLVIIFRNYPIYTVFKNFTLFAVPFTAAFFLLLFLVEPHTANDLGREDRLIEDGSFAFLAFGAIAMWAASMVALRRGQKLVSALAALFGAVFFVIGMEEISWFQRVLEIESNEFFLEHNVQNETNLHNLNTKASEAMYYLGGFLLLTVVPFFRDNMVKVLKHLNMESAKILLPSTWLVAPFIVTSAFTRKGTFIALSTTIIWLGSLYILIALLIDSYQKGSRWVFTYLAGILILFIAISAYFLTDNFAEMGMITHIATEYREFFIAWGITTYAISVLSRLSEGKEG